MPYSSVKELPQNVKDKIKSPKRRRQWMHVFNSEMKTHGDESRAFAGAWSTAKGKSDDAKKRKRVSKSNIASSSAAPETDWRLGLKPSRKINTKAPLNKAKISQKDADYRPNPNEEEQCSKCSMFRKSDSIPFCTLVSGRISPSGWCKYFDKSDAANVRKASSMSDFNFYLPITKINKENRTVSGYASTPSLDLDGEIISLDAVRKALPGYMEWRNIREMHQPSAVGVAKEANIDDVGLYLTSKIVDEAAWQKVLEGVYKGYSVGGKKLAKKGNIITDIDLVEISIVDRPANPDCKISVSKRAKPEAQAHLVKLAKPQRALAKAMKSLWDAQEFLAKEGPPAAHDGFSLPAKPVEKQGASGDILPHPQKCAAHGVENCEKCMEKEVGPNDARDNENQTRKQAGDDGGDGTEKREVGQKERESLASQGKANPDGSFPIKNKSDLDNARQAIGRSKDKSKTRALIVRRARELGVKLPSSWKKKEARALIAKAEAQKRAAVSLGLLDLRPSVKSSFLSLDPDGSAVRKADRAGVGETVDLVDSMGAGMLSPDSGNDGAKFLKLSSGRSAAHESQSALDLSDVFVKGQLNGDENMTADLTNLDQSILDILKRAAQPTRAQRMGMAQSNLKKARDARKKARGFIEDAHKMHKSAYLSKAAKKPKDDGDADDFDHAGAMEKLQKAYGEIQKMGTFMKAATEQLKKVGHTGQRGQEAGDSEGGFYEVPAGVKDLSQDAIAGAKPGTSGSGGKPPAYPGTEGDPSSVYSGKLAKFAKDGRVPAEIAELIAENAALEARSAVIANARPANQRRPYSFDMTKVMGNNGNGNGRQGGDPLAKAFVDSGVSATDIMNRDEDDPVRTAAVANVVGTYFLNGEAGRSVVFDPEFRGKGGSSSGTR